MTLRIGIVCEGQTDLVALEAFINVEMNKQDINASFVRLQPVSDQTQAAAGWTAVLHWLINNPPNVRMRQNLGAGLFANNLSATRCDVIVIQLDTDILGEPSFVNFIGTHGVNLLVPDLPSEKGLEINKLIYSIGKFGDLAPAEQHLHIICPAVDSTETWCIAAAKDYEEDPETFDFERIRHEFGLLIADCNQLPPQARYNNINKRVKTRVKLCKHIGDTQRLMAQCAHFKMTVDSLVEIGTP